MDDAELAQAIARIRRAMPRNADVMAVCDRAEAALQQPVRLINKPISKPHATITLGDLDVEASAHRAFMRRYMQQRRLKPKPS